MWSEDSVSYCWVTFVVPELPSWALGGEDMPSPAVTRCPRVGCTQGEGDFPSLRRGGAMWGGICKRKERRGVAWDQDVK